MNSYVRFYREKMYPFQDGILKIVKQLNTPFYLTGGTAISRYYFNYRFSDDLDFFVNDDENFDQYVNRFFNKLTEEEKKISFAIDRKRLVKSENYSKFILIKSDSDTQFQLQLDFVNDISRHFEKIQNDPNLGRIDSWQNILSNKISALFRYEPKDIVDIWILSKHKQFNWQDIINQAKEKEVGIDPIAVFEIIRSFPKEMLSMIKWSRKIDKNTFIKDIALIADDVLKGNDNNLYQK